MKQAVVYASMTGHSKKIANAIGKELGVEPQNVKVNPTLGKVEVLFIVGGIYGNESMPEMINFANQLGKEQVKKVVLITSRTGKTATQASLRKVLEGKGILVEVEEYLCRGSFLFIGLGHPNRKEIEDAVKFAKKYSK